MKALVLSFTLIFSLGILSAQDDLSIVKENLKSEVIASSVLDNEAYVDDIPFDTKEMVSQIATYLPEEDYVEDIPFNTLVIASQGMMELPEEKTIDDLDFDTKCIVHYRNYPLKAQTFCFGSTNKKSSIFSQ